MLAFTEMLINYSICYCDELIYREELLSKLLMVTGKSSGDNFNNPDSSYVLTADNTKKILAILMRFR